VRYKRILLKLSGEALAGSEKLGIDPDMSTYFSTRIGQLLERHIQVAVVVGGGNFFRGATTGSPMQRPVADQIGMLATMMNALILQQALRNVAFSASVFSAISMPAIADRFVSGKAIHLLEEGHVVIIGGGTGNPFFTTDSAAALRALELNADCMVKATRVDGVYDADPELEPDARHYSSISYSTVLEKNLKALDATAVALCREQNLPVHVINIFDPDSLMRLVDGHQVGTLIGPDNMAGE